MLKRREKMEKEIRLKMRDGKGEVQIVHIFKKEELQGRIRLLAHIRLEKDCSIGYHTHQNEEEIFYIIKGQGRVKDNQNEYQVRAGDALLTGSGSGHTIENKSVEPLEFIAIILLYV